MKWVAHFENYKINQFDEMGNESLFREVLDNIEDLKLFCLYDNESNYYSVDIQTQEIVHNGELLIKGDLDNPKLLYYRRCFLNMGDEIPYVYQCVGLQNEEKELFLKIDQQTYNYEIINK